MKIFILTEKPSVAKSFAQTLRCAWQKKYWENETYIITNCIGHLYQSYYPEDYNENYKKWNIEDLPIIPKEFLYKVNDRVKEQAELIKYLLEKYSYEKIIIATDAGREGELIASIVLKMSGIKSKDNIYRFWESASLTDEVIKEGLKKVKPVIEYEKMESEGYYRSFADWLVGINISRLVTLGSGVVCRCGRVKTAVLYEVYKREQAIENFVPEIYFEKIAILESNDVNIKAKMYTKENDKINIKFSEKTLDKNNFLSKIFIVENKESTERVRNAEKLLNLTALQKKAFVELGLSPEQTLTVAQKLYEEYKCLSYPRTPSRVLGTSDVELAEKIYASFAPLRKQYTYSIQTSFFNINNKNIFNDALLEDHHALLPLCEIPSNASDIEKKVFEIVVKSFFACFSKPYIYEETNLYLSCENEKFFAKGKKDLDLGWKEIYSQVKNVDEEGEEEMNDFSKLDLSNLKCIDINAVEKKTKAKPKYRFDSILAFMENPKNEDGTKKLVGIGTPATRAKILEDLIKEKYLKEQKKNLEVTDDGKFLIKQVLSNECLTPLVDIQTTTKWEEALSDDASVFYEDVKKFVINACKNSKFELVQNNKKKIGLCPVCKKEIYEGTKNYYCSGYKEGCRFSIFKNVSSTIISENDVQDLLNGKLTQKKKCKSKAGKEFTCKFKLGADKKLEFVFEN